MPRDDCANGGETGGESTSEPSIDLLLEVLAQGHRREILQFLRDAPDHTASVDEVVARLVDRETERTGERPGHDALRVSLHHVHLPKLTDAGVVEYDPRSQELRYWPDDRLEDLLEFIRSVET